MRDIAKNPIYFSGAPGFPSVNLPSAPSIQYVGAYGFYSYSVELKVDFFNYLRPSCLQAIKLKRNKKIVIMSPDLESFTAAYNALSFKSPDQGKKKILMQLNAENGWNLSAKEMRERVALMEHDKENGTNGNTDTKGTALARGDEKAKNGDQDKNSFVEPVSEADTINGQEEVQAREISEENAVDTPPSLPCDALKAQIKYKEESTRTFILYGRGKYDYGVTPNSDMQIMIDVRPNPFPYKTHKTPANR